MRRLKMEKKTLLNVWISVCLGLVIAVLPLGRAHAESLPAVLALGTHPLGSLYNAEGSGIASVLSKHLSSEGNP